ncbi:MAG TPA: glycosyltransferase family 4 protein [Verrucomicrobiae bacterium]
MRIAWIYKSPWKKPGPIVYMGVLNAAACAGCGAETDLFVSAEDEADTVSDSARDLRDFYGIAPNSRLRIHRIPEARRQGLRSERPVYAAACRELEQQLQAGEKTVAVTRELGVLPQLLRLRRKYPALRVIHEAHDFYGRIGHLPTRRLRDYRRWFSERFYISRTDGLVCITAPQRELYKQVFPRLPNVYLPLGCVEPRQGAEPEARRLARRVGYIGHLHEAKGRTLLLQAAQQLRPHGVTIECYGGYPKQVETLRNEIAARNLSDAINFQPFCGPAEMFQWLSSRVSIGAAPLQDTYYNRNLTCPVKVLDYLSQGLPVVGSDLPSVRDLAKNAGEYHQPDDLPGLVAAVLRLLDDPARYAFLAHESMRRASELAWPKRAAALLEFANGLRGPAGR